MPQTSESRVVPVQNQIQDIFLNHARRERWSVRIHLMDGGEIEGRIRQFDRFAVILDHDGTDRMIFKHAIASIVTPHSVPSYGESA